MDLNNIKVALTQEQIDSLTLEQRIARMNLIKAAAARGDFGWDFGENMRLTNSIPAEKRAMEKAFAGQQKAAAARAKRMGIKIS